MNDDAVWQTVLRVVNKKLTQIMSIDQLRPDARLATQHPTVSLNAIVIRRRPCIVRRLTPKSMIKVPGVFRGNDEFVSLVQKLLRHCIGRGHPSLNNVTVFGQILLYCGGIGQVTGPQNGFGARINRMSLFGDCIPGMEGGFLNKYGYIYTLFQYYLNYWVQ